MRVVVTGGMSGIGAAIVDAFRQHKCAEIISVDRGYKEKAHDNELTMVPFNLVRVADIPSLVKEIGDIDVLVNNAGIYAGKPFIEYTPEELMMIHNVNVVAPVRLATEFAMRARSKRQLRIINMTSVVSKTGGVDLPYCGTKAELANATLSLAKQFGDRNIIVNAVAPGIVYGTSMYERIPEWRRNELLAQSAAREFARPSEVAAVVLWLATSAPSSVRGTTIHVDAGMCVG